MSTKYDNLIYYSICECLYENMGETKYSTFRNMCNGIGENLNNGLNLTIEQYNAISKAMYTLDIIYHEDKNVMGDYVRKFFEEEIWKKYMKPVTVLKNNLPFAMPKLNLQL